MTKYWRCNNPKCKRVLTVHQCEIKKIPGSDRQCPEFEYRCKICGGTVSINSLLQDDFEGGEIATKH